MVPRNPPIIIQSCFVSLMEYAYLVNNTAVYNTHGWTDVYTYNYVEEREGVVYILTSQNNQKHFIKINVEQRNDRDKQN